MQTKVLFVHTPTPVTRFTGRAGGMDFDRANVGPLDTRTTFASAHILASFLRERLPAAGLEPQIEGIMNMRALPPEWEGANRLSADSPYYRKVKEIPYAGGTMEIGWLGAPMDWLAAEIRRLQPEVVVLTANFRFEAEVQSDVIRTIKSVNPAAKILMGGRDASFEPAYYLRAGTDVIFREDENAYVGEVARRFFEGKPLEGIPGIAYLQANGAVHIGERNRARINDLPLPDLTLKLVGRPDLQVTFAHELYTESQDGPLPGGVSTPLFHAFTSRGCANNCDFCTSAATKYDVMFAEKVTALLTHLTANGIKTVCSAEDEVLGRILWLGDRGRELLFHYFNTIKRLGLAIEFPNGLRPSAFLKKGVNSGLVVDEELIDLAFKHDLKNGAFVGTYRTFIGLERPFSAPAGKSLRKLAPWQDQLKIYEAIASRKIPVIGFGVILPLHYDDSTTPAIFDELRQNLGELKALIANASGGATAVRFGIFCETPLPGTRNWKDFTQIPSEPRDLQDPNLWHYFVPKGRGYSKMWDKRMRLLADIDEPGLASWLASGDYAT
ncbi:MAG: cobalamin-dependent protein [Candidatus Burarchaeum sp.]|nr:cobalamin-dependent protein [Candidatus Burarchaeum sp.]MDO8340084.1 cobalamin-dependent protein [Candidatus Burarchaeum sp.]